MEIRKEAAPMKSIRFMITILLGIFLLSGCSGPLDPSGVETLGSLYAPVKEDEPDFAYPQSALLTPTASGGAPSSEEETAWGMDIPI